MDLSSTRTLDDVLQAIGERAKNTPPGMVIVTNSDWHEGQLVEQRLPYRDDLDKATTDHPVVVVRGGRVNPQRRRPHRVVHRRDDATRGREASDATRPVD